MNRCVMVLTVRLDEAGTALNTHTLPLGMKGGKDVDDGNHLSPDVTVLHWDEFWLAYIR